jgi:hypothetical protein
LRPIGCSLASTRQCGSRRFTRISSRSPWSTSFATTAFAAALELLGQDGEAVVALRGRRKDNQLDVSEFGVFVLGMMPSVGDGSSCCTTTTPPFAFR